MRLRPAIDLLFMAAILFCKSVGVVGVNGKSPEDVVVDLEKDNKDLSPAGVVEESGVFVNKS